MEENENSSLVSSQGEIDEKEKSGGDSIVSELELEKIEDPREREILLLAKVKLLNQKVESKNELIDNLKDTLESDDNVKKVMHKKIMDLKSRIEDYKEEVLKTGGDVKKFEVLDEGDEEENDNAELLINESEEAEEVVTTEQRKGLDYMLTSTALANQHQNKIFALKRKTCWGRFTQRWHNFLNYFTPFKDDIKILSYRFDRGIQLYFELHRFLLLASVCFLIAYIFLLIYSLMNSELTKTCKYGFPCFLFYSRIDSELNSYIYGYLCGTILFGYFCIQKYIIYNKLNLNSKLYEREETKFSQYFFTSWDWSIKTKSAYIEKKKRLRSIYKLSQEEIELKKKLGKNTGKDKCGLLSLRITSWLLSIILLLIHGSILIGIYVGIGIMIHQEENKVAYKITDIVLEAMVPVVICLLNLIFPKLLTLLVYMEQWSYKGTIANQLTIRYFVGRMWGVACIFFFNIYFVILGNRFDSLLSFVDFQGVAPITFGCPGKYTLNNDYSLTQAEGNKYKAISSSLYSNCAEDDVIMNILLIVLAEFVVRKIIDLSAFWIKYCCSSKRQKGFSYKTPFSTGTDAADTFVFYFMLISLLTYFPYMALLIPVIMIIDFKYEFFKLLSMRSKPEKFRLRHENGHVVMVLFNLTIFFILFFNSIYYIAFVPHNNHLECYSHPERGNQAFIGNKQCGPVASSTPFSLILIQRINSVSFFEVIYYFLSQPKPMILLLIFVISILLYNSDEIENYKFYVREKEKDMANIVAGLQGKMENLDEKNKYLAVNKLNRHKKKRE